MSASMHAADDDHPNALAAIELDVRGLHCAGCVARLKSMLEHLPGVASANVSFANGRVRVEPSAAIVAERDAIVALIESAGFYV